MVTLVTLLLAALPTIETPVVDPADYLTPAEEEGLAAKLVALRADTGVQMAIVVVRSTGGRPIEDAAQIVFDRWGGGSSERDDGVLLALAIEDRRSRLHVGYGLEPFLPDSVAKRILDDQRPHLRREDYAAAGHGVVDRVAQRVASLEPGGPIEIPLGMNFPAALLIVFMLGVLGGLVWAYRGVGVSTVNRVVDADEAVPSRGDPGANHWLAPAIAWLGLPLAIGAVFHAGKGFWFAYPMVYLAGAVFATLLVWFYRKVDEAFPLVWGFLAVIAVPVTVSEFAVRVTHGNEVVNQLLMLLIGLGVAGVVAALLRGAAAIEASDVSGGSGGWSSSSSSSWGSSSSSSWSSSSSSSWSSSSSSSSSSWGGGGGSSGGGGASSSW